MVVNFFKQRLKTFPFIVKIYQWLFLGIKRTSSFNVIQSESLKNLRHAYSGKCITIIIPVYNPYFHHFKDAVSSVFQQTYTTWQLILVDDASTDEDVKNYLSVLNDKRICKLTRTENGHISAATNTGLEAATGDFIVLLDQDDLLHPDALKCVAHYIEQHPDADIFYSDEDKIDAKGNRHTPHFKPEFNLELLYSHNYVSHLGVYRRSLIESIGGFREGYEGSQDYDLLLRAAEKCGANKVKHIPYILYHWRALPGSTALDESEKSYAEQAGLKALQSHLEPKGAQVELGMLPNTYKVDWPLPSVLPLVSIIIPTKNADALVKQCIDSIYQLTEYTNFEILLVDNQSDDPKSLEYFAQLERSGKVRLLSYDQPFNYSAINNFAVSKAQGEYVVLMNNDIEIISPSWLDDMVRNLARPDIGCVGAKLYYPNGTLQHAGVITGLGGVAGHSHKHFPKDHPGYFKRLKVIQNLSAVTAACLGVRKSVFHQVNGLNEQDLTVAFNDVDFCLKVQQAGYRNLWSPYIEMVHHESISRGAENTPEKQARFAREIDYMKSTWGQQLLNDPCYSRWLTLDREDFGYR